MFRQNPDSERVRACDLVESCLFRYRVVDSDRIFLYHRLEHQLQRALDKSGRKEELIQSALLGDSAEFDAWLAEIESGERLGVMALRDAIKHYGFLPAGLEVVEFHDAHGSCMGWGVGARGAGMLLNYCARNIKQWADLVEAITCSKPLPEPAIEPLERAVAMFASGEVVWVQVQGNQVDPGPAINKKIPPSDVVVVETLMSGWMLEPALPVKPIDDWDEGAPDLLYRMSAAREALPEPVQPPVELLEQAYEKDFPMLEVAQIWTIMLKTAYEVCQQESAAETLVQALYDDSMLTPEDDAGSLTEKIGLRAKAGHEKESRKGKVGISKRTAQARFAIDNAYPELQTIGPEAVAWLWRLYITDTENPGADLHDDARYRIDKRDRDPLFLIYIAIRAFDGFTIQGPPRYTETPHRLSVQSSESPVEIEAKAWIGGIGAILGIAIEHTQDMERFREEFADTRRHLARLLDCMRTLESLVEAITEPHVGPELFSQSDANYCRQHKIPMLQPIQVGGVE